MIDSRKHQWFGGLERSCNAHVSEHIVSAPAYPGLDRIEASFSGNFFEPHCHDTYAIGITLRGVQTFGYRGTRHVSLPGQVIILHPDEMHDGGAGTEEGLLYRMLYLEPALLRRAMADARLPLPFVKSPVVRDDRLASILGEVLELLDHDLADLQATDFLTAVASSLVDHAKDGAAAKGQTAGHEVQIAREFLIENAVRNVASEELEAVTGLDRFTLSRQFRSAFGTSPHRYQIMRRLDRARTLICNGQPLAETAAATGFADQSHLTRHFKKAFGITPGRWAGMVRVR